MTEAWIVCDNVADPREENRCCPNTRVTIDEMNDLGIVYHRFDPACVSDDKDAFIMPLLKKLHYEAHDVVTISPSAMGDQYVPNITKFFEEHLHQDEEVRLILEGSGFFDVRNRDEKWVRIFVTAGDYLVVPAGIYHRFTTDTKDYTKALRLFRANPKWVAIGRSEGEELSERKEYLQSLAQSRMSIVGPAEGEQNGIYVVHNPFVFDQQVTAVVQTLRTAQSAHPGSDAVLMLYFTGTNVPGTANSWCPDCVVAKPHVADAYKVLKDKVDGNRDSAGNSDTPIRVVFVECHCDRMSYKGNPGYPLRTHSFVHLSGIPTVMVLTPKTVTGVEENKAFWYDQVHLQIRTEEPTVELLTSWLH